MFGLLECTCCTLLCSTLLTSVKCSNWIVSRHQSAADIFLLFSLSCLKHMILEVSVVRLIRLANNNNNMSPVCNWFCPPTKHVLSVHISELDDNKENWPEKVWESNNNYFNLTEKRLVVKLSETSKKEHRFLIALVSIPKCICKWKIKFINTNLPKPLWDPFSIKVITKLMLKALSESMCLPRFEYSETL